MARVRKEAGTRKEDDLPPPAGKGHLGIRMPASFIDKDITIRNSLFHLFLIAARTLFITGIVVIAQTIWTYNFERTRGEIGRHRWRNRDGSSRFVDNGFRRGGSL